MSVREKDTDTYYSLLHQGLSPRQAAGKTLAIMDAPQIKPPFQETPVKALTRKEELDAQVYLQTGIIMDDIHFLLRREQEQKGEIHFVDSYGHLSSKQIPEPLPAATWTRFDKTLNPALRADHDLNDPGTFQDLAKKRTRQAVLCELGFRIANGNLTRCLQENPGDDLARTPHDSNAPFLWITTVPKIRYHERVFVVRALLPRPDHTVTAYERLAVAPSSTALIQHLQNLRHLQIHAKNTLVHP